MKRGTIFILVFLFVSLFALVSADVLSINSGGYDGNDFSDR